VLPLSLDRVTPHHASPIASLADRCPKVNLLQAQVTALRADPFPDRVTPRHAPSIPSLAERRPKLTLLQAQVTALRAAPFPGPL